VNTVLNMNMRWFGIEDADASSEAMSAEDEAMLALALRLMQRRSEKTPREGENK
jgi:hypothetical protein